MKASTLLKELDGTAASERHWASLTDEQREEESWKAMPEKSNDGFRFRANEQRPKVNQKVKANRKKAAKKSKRKNRK